MVKIIQYKNKVLREIAKRVLKKDIGTQKINTIVKNMKEALSSQEDGVAIAAPQIRVLLRIFVVSPKAFDENSKSNSDYKVFINPKITNLSKKKEDTDEGCLSVRWKYGHVKRSVKATVRALDENGNWFSYNGSGLLAQIFQHETDHLDGVLFIDKAKNLRDVNHS